MSGTWRAWAVLAAAAVGGALVQGATAIPGTTGLGSIAFLLAVVASVVALVLEAIAVPWALTAIVRRAPLAAPPWSLVGWGAIVAGLVLAVATLVPLGTPVVWTLAILALPSAALHRWSPLAALRPFRHHPWRSSAAVLVTLVVGILGVVVALATGLFLTGFLGGLAAWAWVGILGAALAAWWARLLRRADRA